MKIKRYKKVQKILQYYSNNFGFHKPYQVLIDGTFCYNALKFQVNIQDQLIKYLDGDVKLLTTPCIVLEVEKLGKKLYGATVIVKQFAIHQCGHGKHPETGAECIKQMIDDNNKARYVVATQDRDLQKHCRKQVGVPLLYLHMTTPTLEAPSEYTKSFCESKQTKSFSVSEHDKNILAGLNKDNAEELPIRKKKKKKGPNPLSCKKKKKDTIHGVKTGKTKKRKRVRSVLVKKIKHELMAEGLV